VFLKSGLAEHTSSLPVYVPGHAKVSDLGHPVRPRAGQQAVPGRDVPETNKYQVCFAILVGASKSRDTNVIAVAMPLGMVV